MEAKVEFRTRARDTAVLFVTLLLFWIMLMGRVTADSLMLGALAALTISLLFRNGLSFFTELRASRPETQGI